MPGWHIMSSKYQGFFSTEAFQRLPFRCSIIVLLVNFSSNCFHKKLMCAKMSTGGDKLWSQFLVCVEISQFQVSRKKQRSTKQITMVLIDISKILPEYLDLTMLDRDASSALPAPEAHKGGNVMTQAFQESPSRNSPPRQGRSVTTAEAELSRITRDTITVPPALQPPDGAATMV